MSDKRGATVEGTTPGKPPPKKSAQPSRYRKRLFWSPKETRTYNAEWSASEDAALVQYVCLYSPDAHLHKWPKTHNTQFWSECAKAVNKACNSNRTGSSCRSRVSKHMSVKFKTTVEAEEAYDICYVLDELQEERDSTPSTPLHDNPPTSQCGLSPIFDFSPRTKGHQTETDSIGDTVKSFIGAFRSTGMTHRMKMQVVQYIFKLLIIDTVDIDFFKFVKSDFLEVSLNAMKTLSECGKHNLVYDLSKCFETGYQQAGPRMPVDRMPFGLIDYNIRFFAAKYTQKLGIEEHYVEWLKTMFAHFGHKFMALFRGPAWQYEVEEEEVMKDIIVTETQWQDASRQDEELVSGVELLCQVVDDQEYVEPLQEETSRVSESNDVELLQEEIAEVEEQEITAIDAGTSDLLAEALLLSNLDLSDSVEVSCGSQEEEMRNVSTLWSHMTPSDVDEVHKADNTYKDMEEFHGISPSTRQNVKQNPGIYNPLKSKTNIASLSIRQIQSRISESAFTRSVDVQMEALKKAKNSNPKGRWWVKADACDIRRGLMQSMQGEWSGDEDLGTGELQLMYKDFCARRQIVKKMEKGLSYNDIQKLKNQLEEDLVFLKEGVVNTKQQYEKVLHTSRPSEALLLELSWDLTGYEGLLEQALKFLELLVSGSKGGEKLVLTGYGPYLSGLYSKKRTAAKYLLIFMISDEQRNVKPYAVPVRFLCYKSITDAKLREVESEVEDAMKRLDMVVVGFSTDGEFNSLRTMGSKRAISLLELTKNARSQAKSMKTADLRNYFTLNNEGAPVVPHPAVPAEDICWLDDFKRNGSAEPMPLLRALHVMRRRLFPFQYDPHGWQSSKEESESDLLKSIMAVYLYRKEVERLKNLDVDPANFSLHLYQPERDEKTSELIHHREDHNHLLKRITGCLREGLIPAIDLRLLKEALHDPNTGLTYEALTGKNKQSVPDCERLFSPGVINFLERHGHQTGARVMRIIHNWHKAVDGRGLTEALRSKYIKDMTDWLLDDWMPYHREIKDYMLIDVNRPVKGICGLTREVVVGLVANLGSRELRRIEYSERGLPPEHPRASSTDDVEGFIALLHEMLGPIFDLKQFFKELPKILNEFTKRIDPNLPFFYWTGAKTRYRDFALPSFNQPSGPGVIERLDRVRFSRRSDPGVFVARRATVPQTGSLTARAQFHRGPAPLPPASFPPASTDS